MQERVHLFLSLSTHTQPPAFQQQAQQVTGGWGAPMATSTQVPGGGGGGMPSYTGARPDTGLTSLQQQVGMLPWQQVGGLPLAMRTTYTCTSQQ